MKDTTKKKLSALLDTYDRNVEEANQVQEKKKSEADEFIEKFGQLREEVIRPVMEQIGAQLKERGHAYEVQSEEESSDSEGRVSPPRIKMNLRPSGIDWQKARRQGNRDYPNIAFSATRHDRKISIHGSNMMPDGGGGSGGPRGTMTLEELTAERIEEEILKLLKEVFERKPFRM